MAKKVGVRHIAERAGVAMSTVSHALNGTAPISADVRARVLEVASEMGYLAQRQAKGAIATIATVMVAVPEEALPEQEANLVSWTILRALTDNCAARGVRIVPYTLGDGAHPNGVVAAAQEAGVDGLILLNDDRPSLLADVQTSGIPAVLVNGEDASMTLDSVTPGNRFSAQKATHWLLGMGFDNVVHLTWEGRKTVRRRLDGYLDALSDVGRRDEAEVLVAEGYAPDHGAARVRDWLAAGGPKGRTALFCAADNLAFGAIKALQEAGLSVPDDISVMGFDGVALGEFHAPALTTVNIPLTQFAEEALSLLQQRALARPDARAARRVELGCNIVMRDSVSPLKIE